MRRNNIEIYRFIFAMGIAIMHLGYYNGFYIGVDFFFMITGIFVYRDVCIENGLNIASYMRRKVKKLFPHIFFSYIVLMFSSLLWGNIALDGNFFIDACLEISQLQIFVPVVDVGNILNGVTWYIGAMLAWLPFIIYMLQDHKKLYMSIIAPYSILLIYAFFYSRWGHIDFALVWIGECNGSWLRALASINMGIILRKLILYLQKYEWNYKMCSIIGYIELAGMVAIVVLAATYRDTRVDFVNIILIAVVVVCSFLSDGLYIKQVNKSKLCGYLGKLSYPIFLNQMWIVNIFKRTDNFGITKDVYRIVLYCIVLILYSMVTMIVVENLSRIGGMLVHKIQEGE